MDRIEKLSARVDLSELLDNLDHHVTPDGNLEDLPPEDCAYRDEGCALAPACLECSLPGCILDTRLVSINKAERDAQIRHLYHQRALTAATLAKLFGVSERTVWRAVKAPKTAQK